MGTTILDKGYVMKNGVYFTLIIFLGTFAYTLIGRIDGVLQAGIVFLLASLGIGFLTTHFTRKTELLPIQKVINIVFISLFGLFGLYSGISLATSSAVVLGVPFLAGSAVLAYSLSLFVKEKMVHHA